MHSFLLHFFHYINSDLDIFLLILNLKYRHVILLLSVAAVLNHNGGVWTVGYGGWDMDMR